MVFTVDGVNYDVHVTAIKRAGKVLDGPKAGRLQNGAMERDIIGTYYNYSVTLDTADCGDYDSLYDVLSAPVDSHTIVMPYGQRALTFTAYVSNVDDELLRGGASPIWGNLSFSFIATEPARTPA